MAVTKLGKRNKLTKEELEAKKVVLRIFSLYPDLMVGKLSKQAESEGKFTRKGVLVSSSTNRPDFKDTLTKMLDEAEDKDEFNLEYTMTLGSKEPITGKIIQEAEYKMNTNIKFENGVSKVTVLQDTTFSVTEDTNEKYKYLFELIDKENKMIKTLTPDELVKYTNDLAFSLIEENIIN